MAVEVGGAGGAAGTATLCDNNVDAHCYGGVIVVDQHY